MVGSFARDSPRCSKRTAVACVTAASTAAWDRPTETAALPRLNHGMMVSSFKPSPLPGLPSRSDSGTPRLKVIGADALPRKPRPCHPRSEEHTSELQSREKLVCRLLLEKKKN